MCRGLRQAWLIVVLMAVAVLSSGCPAKQKEEPLLNEDGYRYKDLRVLWLGHDGLRIKSRNLYIYIDPVQVREGPKAGVILLTSDNPDDLDVNSIQLLMQNDTLIMGPASLSKRLPWKFTALSPGAEVRVKWIRVAAVSVAAKSPRPDSQAQLGVVLRTEGVTLFHSADIRDADDVKDNSDILALQSKLDILAVAIGGSHTINEDGAAAVTKLLAPKMVIPIHYGLFPDSVGRPDAFSRKLAGEPVQVVTTR